MKKLYKILYLGGRGDKFSGSNFPGGQFFRIPNLWNGKQYGWRVQYALEIRWSNQHLRGHSQKTGTDCFNLTKYCASEKLLLLESKKNTNPSQVFSLICLKSPQRKQFMFTTKLENTLQKTIWVEFGRETVNPLCYWQKRFEVLWSSNQTSFGVV